MDIGTVRAIMALRDDISPALNQIKTNLGGFQTAARAAVGAAATAFAGLNIKDKVDQSIQLASSFTDNAAKLGVSVEKYQQLKFAIEQTGGTMSATSTAIAQMSKNLEGNKKAFGVLEDIGVNIDALKKQDPAGAFETIAVALGKMKDPLEQSAAAQAVFGKGAVALLPSIREGFVELEQKAPVMSASVIGAYEAMGDKQEEMAAKMAVLRAQALGPLVDLFMALPGPVQTVAAVVGELLPVIMSVSTAIMAAGGFAAAWGAVTTAFAAVLPFLGPAGLIVAGVVAVWQAWKHWDSIVAFFKGAWQWVVTQLKAFPSDVLLPLLGPVGLVIATFKHWDEIVAVVKRVYEGVKTWLLDKFASLVDGVKGKIDAVTGAFKSMYEAVVGHSFVPDMIDGIAREFARLDSVMVNPTAQAAGKVQNIFGGLLQSFAGGLSGGGIAGGLKSAGNNYGQFVTSNLLGMVPVVGPLLQQFAGPAWQGIKKLGGLIGGIFGGQSKENKHRDETIMGWAGVGNLDEASDKIRELGFAAGISDEEMRSLFSVKKVDEFDRIFRHVTQTIQQFNEKTAASLEAMKEELATPVVIPVTFGMINPGLQGGSTDSRFSPDNFSSFAEWSANWLSRNIGDEHRLNEALGGHVFAGSFASGGRVPGSGPKFARVHGGEVIKNQAQQANDDALLSEIRGLRQDMQKDRAASRARYRADYAVSVGTSIA